jgi:hypothetical protein
LFLAATAALLPLMAWFSDSLDLRVAAPVYAAGLFVCCMFCHGELARLKPAPRHLTMFYLMVSLGGAVGALLVGIVAPNLLSGCFELGIALVACALLLSLRTIAVGRWAGGGAVAVGVATATLIGMKVKEEFAHTRVMTRNFYGVVRTRDYREPVPYRAIYHGGINHGGQLLDAALRGQPSGYFGPSSGFGRVFASLPAAPRRVGVVGLGAGAIAAYARAGDLFRFYEIDPQVAVVAATEFTFLSDSPAPVEIVLGDGRQSLEREPDEHFELLAIDAFSGGSIPMHLLTREAMATYVRHLKPEGVIVFQATNGFVDIAPVLARLAESFGLTAVMVADWPDTKDGAGYWLSGTEQIIVTRNQRLLEAGPISSIAYPLWARPDFRLWTDDFHNLLSILKR